MLKKTFLYFLSKLYSLGVQFRHGLFDLGILKSKTFRTRILCIGNITVGGTGKTPLTETILESLLQEGKKVAVISRGYGRKTMGYIEVKPSDNYRRVGDEPLQMKRKFPEARIVVCEDRVAGIKRIERTMGKLDLIIMDDGFQHRYVKPSVNIVVIDFTRPVHSDRPLPYGSLRDSLSSLSRADYFVVTKCPENVSPIQMSEIRNELDPYAHQKVVFSSIESAQPKAIFADEALDFCLNQGVVAMAGIGNPAPFIDNLKKEYKVVREEIFADHHSYSDKELAQIAKRLEKHQGAQIIMTEKDSVKLLHRNNIPQILRQRSYFKPIKIKFLVGSKEQLLRDIQTINNSI